LAGLVLGKQVEDLPEGWKHASRINSVGKKDHFYVGPAPEFPIRWGNMTGNSSSCAVAHDSSLRNEWYIARLFKPEENDGPKKISMHRFVLTGGTPRKCIPTSLVLRPMHP
jgi:hypothetical protein